MLRRALCALGALSILVPSVASGAPAPGRLHFTRGTDYFASDNVEFLGNISREVDSAGARLLGSHFFITTSRGLSIYNVARPRTPKLVGSLPLPQPPSMPEEDVDTNGKILLIGALGTLYVIDVRDRTAPKIVAELDGADDHTITCVLDCTFAYGDSGLIVDLRRPRRPKVVGDWVRGTPLLDTEMSHDVTEVAPGLVVTSTQPIVLLDARNDPVHPRVRAVGSNHDERFIHGNLWPRSGRDRFLLVGGEEQGPNCDDSPAAAFMVWDTADWRETQRFDMLDEYRLSPGLPSEGHAAQTTWCAHWFDDHPDFSNGGLVAMGWYEHGTHFLKVTRRGDIREVGYFLPLGGSTSAAYWITDRIVYTVDYNRGVDILKFNLPS